MTVARRAAGDGGRLAYLPALDGVRAIAVSMVIAYHLDIGAVQGGFMGVDLFFVLSGFLITTLLLTEHERTGRIGLAAFWLRRARRLLPALFLLLAAIAIAAAWASPFVRDQLRWDVLSALGYVTNWRFIATGQSYFQEFTDPSPVRHLWSLAIEEQFYLVWPLAAIAAFALASRAWGRRVVLVALAAAIGASVTGQALIFDEFNPSVAYYATHTRSHELLIGGLAAVLMDRWPSLRARVAAVGGRIGLVAILVVFGFAVLMSDASTLYYRGGSLVFSIAAAILVATIVARPTGREGWLTRALSWGPLPWIGAISYGLYLWHWPIIVWVSPDTTGLDGPFLAVIRVALTVAIATASFTLIEQPIRRGSIRGMRLGVPQVATGALVSVVLLSGLTVVTTRGAQPLPEFVQNNRKLIVADVPGATGSVGLVGDSVAMSLYPGLAYEAAATHRRLVAAAFPGCPVGEAEHVDGKGAPFPFAGKCPAAVLSEQARMIDDYDPDVVFWLSNRERFDIRVDDTVLQAGTPEWEAATFADWDAVLARLTRRGAKVVLLLPFHRTGDDPVECSGDAWRTEACTKPILAINALREEYRRWAARHAQDVTVIEPDAALCPSAPCPSKLDGVKLRTDSTHFSQEGALVAARRLIALVPDDLWRP